MDYLPCDHLMGESVVLKCSYMPFNKFLMSNLPCRKNINGQNVTIKIFLLRSIALVLGEMKRIPTRIRV
jgi:hypothetical protein